ncbi:MAG: glutamate-5-semialdehyde dehydrogenase [Firmicutes bacterium]|nr:glutamate-5-semialdehyde dehydrogenase [Bacillota bacterium]
MNTELKNNTLKSLAKLLAENRQQVIDANQRDIASCAVEDPVIYDRLKVDYKKITSMIVSIENVIKLEEPVGKTITSYRHENGLKIENKTVPFGTIFIIYEARPDVTIEAAAIAFKAGNKILLKGGKEARNTNLFLIELWHKSLALNNLEKDYVLYLDISREETQKFIQENKKKFDLIIPRGGEALINFVVKHSTVPVIISGRGNNFLYIDSEADFDMAAKIVLNGKQRLSVCNALDKVLINNKIPDIDTKLDTLIKALLDNKLTIIGDSTICKLNNEIKPIADESAWYEEFLSAKILVAMVPDVNEAIAIINTYSGGHSASIVTANEKKAQKFLHEVDCAAVYHNASIRFTDGGEFGLGAEIAISTQKLHFRGPLGSDRLVTNKWLVHGEGQVRM